MLKVGIMMATGVIVLFMHISLSYIIYVKKTDKYKSQFFSLLSILIIESAFWCFFLMFQGFCQIFGKCPGPEIINKIMTPLAIYNYFVCMFGTLLVAVNRFSAICFFFKYETIFSRGRTNLYLILSLVFSAILNLPNWIYSLIYDPQIGTWTYAISPPDSIMTFLKWEDVSFAYIVHALIFILYLIAFVKYRRSRKSINLMQQKEFTLLIQGVMGSSACFFLLFFHHVYRIPNLEFLAILFCVGSEPFVYLSFNSDIRNDFLMIVFGVSRKAKRIYRRLTGSRVDPTTSTTRPGIVLSIT